MNNIDDIKKMQVNSLSDLKTKAQELKRHQLRSNANYLRLLFENIESLIAMGVTHADLYQALIDCGICYSGEESMNTALVRLRREFSNATK